MASKITLADGSDKTIDSSNPLAVTTTTTGGGVAYTDKTITSLGGTSQQLAAANTSRKVLILKNGASSAAVNILGGTAAVGGAGCMTLQSYEAVVLEGAACPTGAINVIGTAGAYFSAFEGV